MATGPYHKWLGIPEDEQPPNHYRLLSVPQFEPDADVIEGAKGRRKGKPFIYARFKLARMSNWLSDYSSYAMMPWTTDPWTSVSRKSRPEYR